MPAGVSVTQKLQLQQGMNQLSPAILASANLGSCTALYKAHMPGCHIITAASMIPFQNKP